MKIIKKMGKKFFIIIPILLVLASFVFLPIKEQGIYIEKKAIPEFKLDSSINDTLYPIKILYPEKKNVNATVLITKLLDRYHYKKTSLNDSISLLTLKNYLKNLDNLKLYFLESDISSFDKYKKHIDDMLKEGNVGVAYQIFAVFKIRYFERLEYVEDLLKEEFDFNKEEYFNLDRKEANYAISIKEQNELWRKYIKNEVLTHILNGKTKKESKEILIKRYSRYRTTLKQYNSADVYQIFINSYTESLDPHTSYFNPITAENFDIEMSKSLEGIGARLIKDGDYTVVYSIIPGGPAFKSDKLHDNDKIIGVAQGKDGKMVDVVGWRNDDVVQLIRGKKGTLVRLNILKEENTLAEKSAVISIIRDKINIEDARAESKIYEFLNKEGQYRLGVITIPSFYKDFTGAHKGSRDFNSTTRDVEKLIIDFKKKNIDGLLIDLRRNGGGALDEAVELTGLFVNHGPIVQVKDYENKLHQEKDETNAVFYEGPLTILTSRLSASASEIFAAAIQDYKRGVIIGEESFGKGTVQSLLGLQQYIPDEKEKLGQLKLTTAKFYRINGGSTQNLGVIPDIKLPTSFNHVEIGESSYKSALKWDQISPAQYTLDNTINNHTIRQLNSKYIKRLKLNEDLQALIRNLKKLKEQRNINRISLNEAIRRKEMQAIDSLRSSSNNKLKPIHYSIEGINKSTSEQLLNLKDIYLEEGLLILADVVSMTDV